MRVMTGSLQSVFSIQYFRLNISIKHLEALVSIPQTMHNTDEYILPITELASPKVMSVISVHYS